MDLTAMSGTKQQIALAGVKSELKSQAVLAGVVGQALEGARQTAATVPVASGPVGGKVNILA